MTMFNEAELIRQLEEQRAVIVQKSAQVNWLQTENSVLHKKCEINHLHSSIAQTSTGRTAPDRCAPR